MPVYRTPHIKHILQILQLHRAINAEVGASTERERIVDANVHRNGTVDDGGVNADHVPLNDSVPGIDGRALPIGDILGFCFADLNFRLQAPGVPTAPLIPSTPPFSPPSPMPNTQHPL